MADHSLTSASLTTSTTTTAPPASSSSASRSLPTTTQDSNLIIIDSSSSSSADTKAPNESRTRSASPSSSSSPTKVARLGIQSSSPSSAANTAPNSAIGTAPSTDNNSSYPGLNYVSNLLAVASSSRLPKSTPALSSFLSGGSGSAATAANFAIGTVPSTDSISFGLATKATSYTELLASVSSPPLPNSSAFSSLQSGPDSADHNQPAASSAPRSLPSFQAQPDAPSAPVFLLGVDISTPAPSTTPHAFLNNTGAAAAPSAPVFCPQTTDPASAAAASSASSSAAADQASSSLTPGASSSGTKLPSENIGPSVEDLRAAAKLQKRANAMADWDKEVMQANNAVETLVATHTILMERIGSLDGHQQEVLKALESIEKQYESMCNDEPDWLHDHDSAPTREAMYVQVESIRKELKQMQERARSTLRTTRQSYQQGGDRNAIGGLRWHMSGLFVSMLNNQLSVLTSFDERAQKLSMRIEAFGAQATNEDQ